MGPSDLIDRGTVKGSGPTIFEHYVMGVQGEDQSRREATKGWLLVHLRFHDPRTVILLYDLPANHHRGFVRHVLSHPRWGHDIDIAHHNQNDQGRYNSSKEVSHDFLLSLRVR